MFDAIDNAVSAYCKLLELLLVALLSVMVIMVFGNVVLRYGFNSGVTVSEELSRWAFVWMIFLGAIVAVKENTHLGTDVLLVHLGPLGKRICLGLAEVAELREKTKPVIAKYSANVGEALVKQVDAELAKLRK